MEGTNGFVKHKNVKEYCNALGYRMSKETYTQLDQVVARTLEVASKRAKQNNRTTIMQHDL